MLVDQPCIHHWLIQPARGPTSEGTCKFCREVREFQNIIGTQPWGIRDNRAEAYPVATQAKAEYE